MTAPAVSVILPTFNRLAYLREAVGSVLTQTFTDWELIVADDGSQPETAAYLAVLGDAPRTRVLRLAHSGNPAMVRNAALREARGTYVAFLDSDDRWLPRKLEVQLAVQRSRASCRWSYTTEDLIEADGTLRARAPGVMTLHEGAIFEPLLTLDAALSTPCVLAERALIEAVGGFDEGQRFFEDYDLWLRLSLRSDVAAIAEPLAQVRNHAEHYSADRVGVYQSRLRLIEKMTVLATGEHQHALLHRERAKTAADLARAYAASGRRSAALGMLWHSRTLALAAGHWWSDAAYTLAVAGSPAWLRSTARRYRRRARAR